MTVIDLPVSIGEALDKLSILEIKNDIIGNEHVRKEYVILKDLLSPYLDPELYPYLVHINTVIWEQMDILRNDTQIKPKLFQECLDANDIRFKIKNKINIKSQSQLKEQKSYAQTSVKGSSDNPVEILLYTFIYDRVLVYTKNNMIKKYFENDPTIEFTNIPLKSFPSDYRLEFFKIKN